MENIMDIAHITSSIEKTKIYKDQEELQLSNIKEKLSTINYYYKTNNTNKFTKKANELSNKFKIISQNHSNNISIINKNIEKYQTTSTKVEQTFNNII